MSKKRWFLLIIAEGVLIFIAFLKPSTEILTMICLIQVEFIIVRNAKYLKSSYFKGAIFLRRTLYFIPYLMAITYFWPSKIEALSDISDSLFLCTLLSILLGIMFLFTRITDLKKLYNRQFMMLFPPVSLKSALLETYSLIGSAILQEMFYKGFIIALLYPLLGVIPALLISSGIFVIEHMIHFNAYGKFKIYDFIGQFALSLTAGVLYLMSGSIIMPIIIHTVYNAPIAFSYFVRRIWSQKEVSMI